MRLAFARLCLRPGVARRFLLVFVPTIAVLVTNGWLTGLRDVMYGALVGALAVAFLPFTFVALALALVAAWLVLVMLVAMLTDGEAPDGGELVGEVASALTEAAFLAAPPYYRLLGRIRHPGVWGGFAGVFSGGLVLWGLIALFVVPRELETVERLARARERVEAHRKSHHAFPPAGDDGAPRFDEGEVEVDGFGRPFVYRTQGLRPFDTYTLSSLGFDGRPGEDDLCVEGSTALGRAVPRHAALLDAVTRSVGDGFAKTKAGLGALRQLRCDDASRR
jgi:hypothetical protein